MKRNKRFLMLFVVINLAIVSLCYPQQTKSTGSSSIRGLPNGFTVKNFSISIWGLERNEEFAIYHFICRKTALSTQDFPFNSIRVIDDHGGSYESNSTQHFSNSDQAEYFIKKVPLGFTWTFSIAAKIPEAAPILKMELLMTRAWSQKTLIKTINFSVYKIKKIDIEKEI